MKGKSVFAGLKLSEQTAVKPAGLDQRLFGPAPPPVLEPSAPTVPPTLPAAPDPTPSSEMPPRTLYGPKDGRKPPVLASPPSQPTEPLREPQTRFEVDLSAIPYRKDTFLFTSDEFEALEDLKLEIGRALDVKVTKQNLVRCALAHLIDDWRRKGVASSVIAPLKRRLGR